MCFEILWESFNTGNHCHRGKFTQRTQAFALHLFGNVEQQIHIGIRTMTVMKAFGNVQHPVSAFAAGGAFPQDSCLKK